MTLGADTGLHTGNGEFQPQVATFGGWLPGSAAIAGAASQERGGSGLIERIRLAPYARIAIQMGIAVGGAIIVGDAISGRRFYWAVIAAFITFMGANTAGEQLRKSVFRVAGTVVGVIVGAVLAHLVGDVVLAADRGDHGLALPRPVPVQGQLRVHGRRHHRDGVAAVRGAR